MRLNPTDVFKLLDSLISMIQSRGAVLACAVPWLRSLLVLHLSRIMSQESSLVSLNSLSELIESRIGTLSPALQLASSLDFLCSGVEDDGLDDYESAAPVIFEDNDESEEEEESRDDVMDTDEDNNELEELSGISGVDELEDLAN
uniref:Small-subunit processome Utp12 domain-containing protein n=2 Tax=Opuntia streptacantha TaxID=393608 RepID=A0A7C8YU27_OPUST